MTPQDCTVEAHEEAKRERWSSMLNHRPWPGEAFEIAECPVCKSTLALPVEEVASEAA